MDSSVVEWEEVADILSQFCLFVDEPEMRWFKKAWQGFMDVGRRLFGRSA